MDRSERSAYPLMDGSMYHLIGAVQYDCSSSTKKILMHIIINDVLLYVGVHPKEL